MVSARKWQNTRKVLLDAIEMCKIYIALDRLKEYQRLEEQGLLLRLPCKVGDTVYALTLFCEICEHALDNEYACEVCNKGKFVTETKFNYGERLPEEPEVGMQEMEELPEYNVMIEGPARATTLHYVGDSEWYDCLTQGFYKVIAWQPLPEPYQPKERSNGLVEEKRND